MYKKTKYEICFLCKNFLILLGVFTMKKELFNIYEEFEKLTESKVIAYVTGDRPRMETVIGKDVIDIFGDHLESMGKVKKITLILYTCGGDTMAAWNLINLIREYCDELDIIVPRKARSAGTIMCLGANKIYMTRQSTLGPIDPSINNPLCPKININGNSIPMQTSVESVKGYFDLAKNELKIKTESELIKPFIKISENLHPLLLGDVYRIKEQIKMIAQKLLDSQLTDKKTKERIVNFLCSDSGSHDYSISFTEAKNLGLKVDLVTTEMNSLINRWYQYIEKEMLLRNTYDPVIDLAQTSLIEYNYIRACVDSINYGRNIFVSQGKLMKIVLQTGMPNQQINDTRIFEGWKKDD